VKVLGVIGDRAADRLQLAAALSIAGDVPGSLAFMCLDRRLADAARREGATSDEAAPVLDSE
jgi:hypothetical protein